MTQIIHIQSLKSGGATQTALQLSLYHKQKHSEVGIALCQVHHLPDIARVIGVEKARTWADWGRFWNTSEWKKERLDDCKNTYYGVDVFSSPYANDWKTVETDAWVAMVSIVAQKYDVIYLDMPYIMEERIQLPWRSYVTKSLWCTSLLPASIDALSVFLEKDSCVVNQVPKRKKAVAKQFLGKFEKQCIGYLPSDDNAFWDQIYEHGPVVFQKKSAYREELSTIWNTLFYSSDQ